MTTLQELQETLQRLGLSSRTNELLKLAKPAIQIKLNRAAHDNDISIGQSKMGGSPDLPVAIEWPYWNEMPLTFIGQFHLTELAPFNVGNELPNEGMLYFFYEANGQPWGFSPSDKNSGRVFFFNGNFESLRRVPHPTAKGKFMDITALFPCNVEIVSTLTLPTNGYFDFEAEFGLTESEIEQYWEVTDQKDLSYLLGYPHEIQGDMRLECQLVTNGLYVGDSTGYTDPRRTELEKHASDWRLLLQVASNEKLGVMWGDDGNIYYWIRWQDLEISNFNSTWVVLQCY